MASAGAPWCNGMMMAGCPGGCAGTCGVAVGGSRLMEPCCLRLEYADFDRGELMVRQGKGGCGVRSPLDGLAAPGSLATPGAATAEAALRDARHATRPMPTGSAQITSVRLVERVPHNCGWRSDLRR